jgi:hypothetical protein
MRARQMSPLTISLLQRLNKFASDRVAVLAAFLLFIATAAYYNIPEPEFLNTTFGWEYGNIAASLALGHGFANAFTPQSGATAWMPPLFVFFLAGVFKIFGVKSLASMWLVLVVKYAALAASLYFLLSVARQAGYGKFKHLLSLIFITLVFFNRDAFFRSLHDDWVNLFFVCWSCYALSKQVFESFESARLHLYSLSILLPLTNPALTLAFALAEGFILLSRSQGRPLSHRWKPAALFLLIAASTLAWAARNYQAFGALIPIKSNFWYDFYQANVLDTDGLTTNETFAKYHLINKNENQQRYLAEGEARFTASYYGLSTAWIRVHPSQWLANIGRRAFSAFVYSHYVEDIPHTTPNALTGEDIQTLQHAGLIYIDESNVPYWISTSLSQREFEAQIAPLNLGDPSAVVQDWSRQTAALEAHKRSWKIVVKTIFLSIVPSLCIVIGLLIRKIRANPVFSLAVLLYLTYLAPYIVTSFYRRYQTPLIGLQSIFIFLAACALLEQLLPKTSATDFTDSH